MQNLEYTLAACTDIGNGRQNNEDNFYIQGRTVPRGMTEARYAVAAPPRDLALAAVFDGMGGLGYGEEASAALAELLTSHTKAVVTGGEAAIAEFVREGNNLVCARSEELHSSMGSTMVIATIYGNVLNVYNIGDSPAYILSRDGTFTKLTRDHTVAQQLLNVGALTPEQARTDKRRHQLTQHFGIDTSEYSLSAYWGGSIRLCGGERILLCSDGVSDGLSEEDIAVLLGGDGTSEQLAERLVSAAVQSGFRDNMTAVVITVAGEVSPEPEQVSYAAEPPVMMSAAPAPEMAMEEPQEGEAPREMWKTVLLWALCALLAGGLGVVWSMIYNVVR